MVRAIYPGSFDPVTNGHIDIIKRAAKVVDVLIVGVLNNKSKTPLFSVQERVKMLDDVAKELAKEGINNIRVMTFDGLLVNFANQIDANVIVRGLRAVTDFEYEFQMAQTNRKLNPNVETLFLTTSVEYSYLSSSTVREVASFGGDITQFVPDFVEKQVLQKIEERNKK